MRRRRRSAREAEWLLTLHPDRKRVEAWDEARPVWFTRAKATAQAARAALVAA